MRADPVGLSHVALKTARRRSIFKGDVICSPRGLRERSSGGKKDRRRGVAVRVTSVIDRIIAALSEEHAALATLVLTLTGDQLAGPSGAVRWPICEVLGHLGSGAAITLAGLRSTLEGRAAPAAEFNGPVWDRWNAMSADEKCIGYLASPAPGVSPLADTTRRAASAGTARDSGVWQVGDPAVEWGRRWVCPCAVDGFTPAGWTAAHGWLWNLPLAPSRAGVPATGVSRGVRVQDRGALMII